ncbi:MULTISPECIES: ArsR/SmtB family transcription factor [Lacticaseibacillus]|uniref:ArsR/SmtB family transcription factor n=2 Tax=Lacticaseibacillus TaxID=2759736 RepID=A0ABW4CIS4_9LACO|nr:MULTISPECIES: ArsR family transcriptional regulator [Lacticaseibacillus]
MELQLDENALVVLHALDSETRIEIMNQLAKQPMNVTRLASELHYSKAIVSKHLKALGEAGLIVQRADTQGDKRQKVFAVQAANINFSLPETVYPEFKRLDYELPLGNYFANEGIEPSCGLANKDEAIGDFDDPTVFLQPERLSASLLWFTKGRIEYMLPNEVKGNRRAEMIDISFEISSEFPGSNNNWPSDISFWLNDVKIGTITVPANYSDVRGKLTPRWWPSTHSQYGVLKHLHIQRDSTGLDGYEISKASLANLDLQDSSTLRFAIGIDPTSPHQGGMTLFGKDFGNYPQDIHVTYYFSKDE